MKKQIMILFLIGLNLSVNAQIGVGTTAPDPSAVLEVSSSDRGFLIPRVAGVGAITQTPAAGLMIYDTTEQCLKYYNGTDWSGCLSDGGGSLLAASGTVDCGSATINGTYEAGTALTASETLTVNVDFTVAGVWSASTGTINGYSFVGSGTVTATGVQSIVLTATGTPTTAQTDTFTLSFNSPTQTCGFDVTVTSAIAGNYPVGTVFCESGPTAIVDVTSSITSRVWMDRNLGASQVATSSTDAMAYGDLYQWGRFSDGHQCRSSTTTSTLSSSDVPGHDMFITTGYPYDWRSPSNDVLWQGISGINNPCPTGYRLPTEAEVVAEFSSIYTEGPVGVFNHDLKLTMTGKRSYTGSIDNIGTTGSIWTSTLGTSPRIRTFHFTTGVDSYMSLSFRGYGQPVRCIKD